MENDFPTARYVPPYMQPFMQGLKQLCASREDADVLIRCGSSEWKAHKAIVCAQWPFVDKALRDYKASSQDFCRRIRLTQHRREERASSS